MTDVISLVAKGCYMANLICLILGVYEHECDRCYVTRSQNIMWLFYLSSREFTSTSSHMCGSWYLPVFLFRHGSLTDENGFFD